MLYVVNRVGSNTTRLHVATEFNLKIRLSPMSVPVLLHSKKQAAAILGISERGLHSLIATKQLKVRRVGRRVLVPQSELLKFAQTDQSGE